MLKLMLIFYSIYSSLLSSFPSFFTAVPLKMCGYDAEAIVYVLYSISSSLHGLPSFFTKFLLILCGYEEDGEEEENKVHVFYVIIHLLNLPLPSTVFKPLLLITCMVVMRRLMFSFCCFRCWCDGCRFFFKLMSQMHGQQHGCWWVLVTLVFLPTYVCVCNSPLWSLVLPYTELLCVYERIRTTSLLSCMPHGSTEKGSRRGVNSWVSPLPAEKVMF